MRKMYIVPNFVTTLNMFFGFFSVVSAIRGDFILAAWCISIAAVFDLLDGRVARLARATSSFGVEYDSLCDLISFGMAPALLFYLWVLAPLGRLGWLIAFLYLVCGGLRLARFNVMTSKLPANFFQGLPIPMAANVLSGFLLFAMSTGWPAESHLSYWAIALLLGMGLLMVSAIPFPSFKEINWRSRASVGYLLIVVVLMILIAVRPEVSLFVVMGGYVALSLSYSAYRILSGNPVLQVQKTR